MTKELLERLNYLNATIDLYKQVLVGLKKNQLQAPEPVTKEAMERSYNHVAEILKELEDEFREI